MGADLLDDLVADAVHRAQRGDRVLEDHRDLLAADPLQLVLRGGDQLAARRAWPSPPKRELGPRVSPIRVITVTDLPEPDSPTMATTSPRSSVNETPSTARTTPSSVWNETCEILDVEQPLGHGRPSRRHQPVSRIRGSSTA